MADAFFGEDVPADTLKQIVYDTLQISMSSGPGDKEYLFA